MIEIIHILTIFYFFNGGVYFIGILILLARNNQSALQGYEYPLVNIIVPARNEEANIKSCLDSLLVQDYPSEKIQIIAVNDGSSDNTGNLLEEYAHHSNIITSVQIQKRKHGGKINALDEGIKLAEGEIVLTTDADVQVGKSWVTQMVNQFSEKTGMVFGMTVDKFSFTPLMLFQALDGAGIRIVSAILALFKFPITCQGANLAFRKTAYLQVRESVTQLGKTKGNREWLLQEINNKTKWKIKPIVHPHSFGTTQSPNTWIGMINQRARWASTGKDYSSYLVKIYLGLIFLSMINFISTIFILPAADAAHLWLLKAVIDFPVALGVITIIRQPLLIFAFPFTFFFQPIFIIITGILGTFNLYKWK